MKTKLFNFDGFFGKKKPDVTLNSNAPIPKEVEMLTEEIKKITPQLQSLVRMSRHIPVQDKEVEIVLLVDGRFCKLQIKDDLTPANLLEKNSNLPVVPKDDLVASIEGLLRSIYAGTPDQNVLGAVWSPHHSAAQKIGEILTMSRDRDRKLIGREVNKMLDSFKY